MTSQTLQNNDPIKGREDLLNYFLAAPKPLSQHRIGTEYEWFVFNPQTLQRIPYHGSQGVLAILESLQKHHNLTPIFDGGLLIALKSEEGFVISIEPGGQIELSGAALPNLHDTQRELAAFSKLLKPAFDETQLDWLGGGVWPLDKGLDQLVLDRPRYQALRRRFAKVNGLGREMMDNTASIQVSLDFSSEEDMQRKIRLVMRLQPFLYALTQVSPWHNRNKMGLSGYRWLIWEKTDPQHYHVPDFFYEEGPSFERYLDDALARPLFFVQHEGIYHDAHDITFGQWLDNPNLIKGLTPTMGDWITHLTTLFYPVRLKNYLEVRGADMAIDPEQMMTIGAFWVGAFESDAISALEAVFGQVTATEIRELEYNVPRQGLNTLFRGQDMPYWLNRFLPIIEKSLVQRARLDDSGQSEAIYLSPLHQLVKDGQGAGAALQQLAPEGFVKDYALKDRMHVL